MTESNPAQGMEFKHEIARLQSLIDDCELNIQSWQKRQDNLNEELSEVKSLAFIFDNGVTRSDVFIPSEYRGSGSPSRFREWLREVQPQERFIMRQSAVYVLTNEFAIGNVTPIKPAHLGL